MRFHPATRTTGTPAFAFITAKAVKSGTLFEAPLSHIGCFECPLRRQSQS